MHAALLFTPVVQREEAPHGQGLITYTAQNSIYAENVPVDHAPDPIRQGDVPSRRARMPIALMSLRPDDWGYGIAPEFIPYARILTRRLMPAGRQLAVRSQNPVGVRPNITKPSAVAYGSLFTLSDQTYDIARL